MIDRYLSPPAQHIPLLYALRLHTQIPVLYNASANPRAPIPPPNPHCLRPSLQIFSHVVTEEAEVEMARSTAGGLEVVAVHKCAMENAHKLVTEHR